jgi:hypothetical protein
LVTPILQPTTSFINLSNLSVAIIFGCSEEMTSLRASFQACIQALRVARPTFAGASPNLVMDAYEQALTMYTMRNDLEGNFIHHPPLILLYDIRFFSSISSLQ